MTVFFNCVKKTCLKVIFLELEGVGLVVAPGIRDRRIKFSFHGAGQGGAGWGRGLNLRAGQGRGVYQLIEITVEEKTLTYIALSEVLSNILKIHNHDHNHCSILSYSVGYRTLSFFHCSQRLYLQD